MTRTFWEDRHWLVKATLSHHIKAMNNGGFSRITVREVVYNRLPQNIVDSTSVQAFQSILTKLARRRCLSWDANWRKAFRDCGELWKTL